MFFAKLSPSPSSAGLALPYSQLIHQISSGTAQISSGIAQISSGTARIVSHCVELNIFIFWDGSTLNHFVIYHFDEKYQCLLIKYKLIRFQLTQEQKQQPLVAFENL